MASRQRSRSQPLDAQRDDDLDAYFEDELILQDYISRLLELQDERGTFLEKEDLTTTAQDLGLTDEELQKVEAAVEAHRKRGANYAKYNRWDDAIDEYRQAVALAPFDQELALGLARAYQGRWQKLGHAADREEAARYARRAIDLDADYAEAFRLLEELDRQPIRATTSSTPSRSNVVLSTILLAGGLIALLVAVIMFLFVVFA
jgi:tetratricopeptide (TPR) repeat protein